MPENETPVDPRESDEEVTEKSSNPHRGAVRHDPFGGVETR